MRRITYNEIVAITQGASRIVEDNGYRFYRFTEEQERIYHELHPEQVWKIGSTAGICLEFSTNSRSLYMDILTERGTSRNFYSFDILCNGSYVGCISNFNDGDPVFSPEYELGRKTGSISLPDGEKVVKVVFPWSVTPKIIEICIDIDATLKPVRAKDKMFFLGDSITHGYDAMHPKDAYTYKISEALGVEAINKAIGGEIFFPELIDGNEAVETKYILVAYGTNDWSKCTREEFEANCSEFYRRLVERYPTALIFALTPIWRRDENAQTRSGNFRGIKDYIFEVAEKYENILPIDGYDLVPHNGDLYFSDLSLHPNSDGFEFYASNLITELKKILRSMK